MNSGQRRLLLSSRCIDTLMDVQAKPGLVFAEQPPVPSGIQELLNAKTRNSPGRRVHDRGLSACIVSDL